MSLVFSGIQPTGNLHLGNYLGAIRNWVTMQHEHPSIFCIVDMHAITVPQDPEALTNATRETAAAYLASGIDPKISSIFIQSMVSGHAELSWILGTITPLGWLNRMTQFKDKAKLSDISVQIKIAYKKIEQISNININRSQNDGVLHPTGAINVLKDVERAINDTTSKSESAYLGLYGYPVLMAADILLYKATHVPVGEDQKQHLELARDIAGAFNRRFNTDYFTLPEPLIKGEATRIMSLRDGTKKMSKSDVSDFSRITLTDDADTIAKKIKKATTDAFPTISYDTEARPEISNLINIYAALSGTSRKEVTEQFISSGTGAFKQALTDVAVSHLAPITEKMRQLMQDTTYLDSILREGAEKANIIAEKHMHEIKKIVGFLKV